MENPHLSNLTIPFLSTNLTKVVALKFEVAFSGLNFTRVLMVNGHAQITGLWKACSSPNLNYFFPSSNKSPEKLF